MTTTTFRACYFIPADSQSDVLLTDETMATMTDAELISEAKSAADQIGIDLEAGRLVVGDYTRK